MKYMVLMNATQSNWSSFGSMSADDIRAHIDFMLKTNADLKASGELVDAQGLTGPEQAKLVSARTGGPPVVTDGPFAEAKEFLAGFWIVNMSPERVIEFAAHISSAPGVGGVPMNFPVEVRPIGEAPNV